MEGCWANDKLNGYGRTITSQGCYIGDFKDDMMHGYGSLTLRNGEKYVGQWKEDRIHGQGTEYKEDSSVKNSGKWENDRFIE